MKRLLLFLALVLMVPVLPAAEALAPETKAPADTRAAQEQAERERTTAAAAAAAAADAARKAHTPGLLEHLVDSSLEVFNVRSASNSSTVTHYAIAAVFLVLSILLRRVVTGVLFRYLRKLAEKTTTTLDDKMFPALEPPVATFIMLVGIFAALSVLKLSPTLDTKIDYASTVAFSLVIFWGLFRAFSALLDHGHELAAHKNLGIAAFMPWIKKTLLVVFSIIGVLMVIQSLGYGENVKTVLAGLGIGSLAFALAAQDTIANLFGSIVIAIDQPFKIGEAVKIGANEGTVEDIGLRSTKLRTPAKNLVVIPNKLTAAEPIINNSRFIRRRFEQVLGLTYDTKPAQMEEVVTEIKNIIIGEKEVDAKSVMVFFRDFSASSLDIWVVYEATDPDFQKSMRLKQRINLAIMRAVEARGLSFAFPTQALRFEGEIAEKLVRRDAPRDGPPGEPRRTDSAQ